MTAFWRHSLGCGIGARVLATHMREPNVERYFVACLLHDIGRPVMATVSYNEGTRWADSGEPLDSVALPADWLPWIGEFVEQNYVPEQRKKKKRLLGYLIYAMH